MTKPESMTGQPFYFFKVGALGSFPLEFPVALADRFQARLLSSDSIRTVLKAANRDIGTLQRIDSREISLELHRLATPGLIAGQHLVADIFYNNPNTRSRYPKVLAHNTDAIPVAINADTPLDTVVERVERWSSSDVLGMSAEDWDEEGVLPVHAAKNMYKTYVPATSAELQSPISAGYALTVDGTMRTEEMVEAVVAQLVDVRALQA